jgi:hypothetical protein
MTSPETGKQELFFPEETLIFLDLFSERSFHVLLKFLHFVGNKSTVSAHTATRTLFINEASTVLQ